MAGACSGLRSLGQQTRIDFRANSLEDYRRGEDDACVRRPGDGGKPIPFPASPSSRHGRASRTFECAYRALRSRADLIAPPEGAWFARGAVGRGVTASVRDNELARPTAWSGRKAECGEPGAVRNISICRVASCASPRCAPGRIRRAFSPGRHKNRPRWEVVRALFNSGIWPSADRRILFGQSAEGVAEKRADRCACYSGLKNPPRCCGGGAKKVADIRG